jgi:hypothetical protein
MKGCYLTTCCLLAASCLLPLQQKQTGPSPDPPDVNPQYFPTDALPGSQGLDDFDARWFAKHLRAMGEPSLLQDSRDDALESYRFLCLPTFSHPIAIRLRIRPHGPNDLVATELSGEGGYEPGKIAQRKIVALPEKQAQEFLQLVQKSDFWSLPTKGEGTPNVIVLDATEWILEGVKGGKYHVVVRLSSDEKTNYAAVCVRLLAFSQLNVNPKAIY